MAKQIHAPSFKRVLFEWEDREAELTFSDLLTIAEFVGWDLDRILTAIHFLAGLKAPAV